MMRSLVVAAWGLLLLVAAAPASAQSVGVTVRLRYPDAYQAGQAHGEARNCTASAAFEFVSDVDGATLDGIDRVFFFILDAGRAPVLWIDIQGRGIVKMSPMQFEDGGDVVVRLSDGLVWQYGNVISDSIGYATVQGGGGGVPLPYSCDPNAGNYQPCLCASEVNPGTAGCCDPASIHYRPEVCDDDGDGIPGFCDPDSASYNPLRCDCDNDGICDNGDCSSAGYGSVQDGGEITGCGAICWTSQSPRLRCNAEGDSVGWEVRPPSGPGRHVGPIVCAPRGCGDDEVGEGGGLPGGGGGGGGGGTPGGGGGGGGTPGGGGGGGNPDLPGGGWEPPFWDGPEPPDLDDCCKLLLYSLSLIDQQLFDIHEELMWWRLEGSVDLRNRVSETTHEVFISNQHLMKLVGGYRDGEYHMGLWEQTFGPGMTYQGQVMDIMSKLAAINDGLQPGTGAWATASAPPSDLERGNGLDLIAPSTGEGAGDPIWQPENHLKVPTWVLKSAEEEGAPVWEWNIQMPPVAGISFAPVYVSVDWNFFIPYRLATHIVIMLGVFLWAASTIWEEFRRY